MPGKSPALTNPRPTIEWDDFRLVKAVADTGSLPAAATALGLNHSTVFRRLKQVEQTVGHTLFERHRNGYVPTPAGEEMLSVAATMADGADEFARRVAGRDLAPAGEVRLTTSDTLLVHLLVPMLARFRTACPAIRLELLLANQGLNLSRRDADVAVRATDTPPDTLIGRRTARLPWALYGPSTWKGGSPNTWVTLGDAFSHTAVARRVRAAVPDERLVCKINTVLGLAEMVEAGVGIGYLPCFLADSRDGLTRLSDPDDALAVDLWLLTHPDLRHVPRVRALMDFLADEIAKCRPLIEGGRPRVRLPRAD